MKKMHRHPLHRVVVRALVALFACAQFSPSALAWCISGDGHLGMGCLCQTCVHISTGDQAAGCGDSCCPAPADHAISTLAGCDDCQLSREAGGCCEHIAIQYLARSAHFQLPVPQLVAVLPVAPLTDLLVVSERVAPAQLARGKLPPELDTSPMALGSAPLPLRI